MTSELMDRIHRLQEYLAERSIDLAVLNRNSDLYYYTGSVQPLNLLVPARGEPIVVARKAITRIADEVTHIPFEPFSGTKDLVAAIERHGLGGPKRVGYTLDSTTYATVTRFQQLFGSPEIADLSYDIRTLRMVKSEAEIAILARAGEIESRMPEIVKSAFRPGMTELDLSMEIERYFRLSGHGVVIRCRREGTEIPGFGVCSSGVNSLAGTRFDGICAGVGLSSAVPYGATTDVIERGVPVILDYSFVLDGYHVDETRMFSWGAPSDRVMKVYDAMVGIERAIIEQLKPGATWESIYYLAVDLAAQAGYSEEFMGLGTEKVKFVGHGVGLELDEPPFLAPKMPDALAAGMVVAVEPKVGLPGIGVVGIEDTFVITNTTPRNLTPNSDEYIVV